MSAEDHVVLASEMKAALAPHFYLSPEVFRLETERIFHHQWFAAARTEQLPARGSVLQVEIAGESVIVVRGRDDALDVVDFWDVVNQQNWRICEVVQAGMRSRGFRGAFDAPMEDPSLDIRGYLEAHLGDLTALR